MPLKPLDILLLDDDATLRAFVAEVLHELGAGSVWTAADGREGLTLIETAVAPPNVLICDLVMPGMDGIEFLRHVAAGGYDSEVVVLSGASPSVLKAAERLAAEHGLGFLGVLEKPINVEQLADVLSRSSSRTRQPLRIEPPVLNMQDLRDGIAAGCVELHYQPKLRLRTEQVVGVECLARWRHPAHGLLSPGSFIPQAEHYGLIDALNSMISPRCQTKCHRPAWPTKWPMRRLA